MDGWMITKQMQDYLEKDSAYWDAFIAQHEREPHTVTNRQRGAYKIFMLRNEKESMEKTALIESVIRSSDNDW